MHRRSPKVRSVGVSREGERSLPSPLVRPLLRGGAAGMHTSQRTKQRIVGRHFGWPALDPEQLAPEGDTEVKDDRHDNMPLPSIHVLYGPKVSLGTVEVSLAARKALSPGDILDALARHAKGDWGDCKQYWQANDARLTTGDSVCSLFWSRCGVEFSTWTSADRSRTEVDLADTGR